MMVHPIVRKYIDVVRNKLIPYFPITTYESTHAKSIFGPNLSGVRGKTVRNKPIRVDTEEYLNIPEDFYKLQNFVTLTSDFMFVNVNASMVTSEMNPMFLIV